MKLENIHGGLATASFHREKGVSFILPSPPPSLSHSRSTFTSLHGGRVLVPRLGPFEVFHASGNIANARRIRKMEMHVYPYENERQYSFTTLRVLIDAIGMYILLLRGKLRTAGASREMRTK